MDSELSGSSLSSFFSANSSRRDTLVFLGDDEDDSSSSDTVTESTCTPTISSSSITLTLSGCLVTSDMENLLSMSLSVNTFSSSESSGSLGSIPPFSTKSSPRSYSPFVNLTSSPFIRLKQRSLSVCSEDLTLKTTISTPTAPRLKPLLTEKIYVAGWAGKLRSFYIPEHIPWSSLEDEYAPMPWIPEGSLVSKDRFYEIRHQLRPKSYSPPPSPGWENISVPADPPPFLFRNSESPKRRPLLKRSASCHPVGSWRVRREALVIDGKISVDNGQDRKHWSLQLPSSSSEPNKMDMVLKWQKMNAFHESGLERLKKSMMKLIEEQVPRSPEAFPAIVVPSSLVATPVSPHLSSECPLLQHPAHPSTSPVPLAIRRGQRVPSSIAVKKDMRLAPLPYPDVPTPYRGSPSAGTPLFEFATVNNSPGRISMDATDMCQRLRSIIGPLDSSCSSASQQDQGSGSANSTPQCSFLLEGTTIIHDDGGIEVTPLNEWAFADDLQTIYGDDPFSYFAYPDPDSYEHNRPLSLMPEVFVSEDVPSEPEASNTVTSSHSNSSLQQTVIPEIVISEEEWAKPQGSSTLDHRSSIDGLLSNDCSKSLKCKEFHIMSDVDLESSQTSDSTHDSPHPSSEDEDVPLIVRRRTIVTASLCIEPSESPINSSMTRIQSILKPIKTVRFASSPSEHVYPAEGPVTHPPSGRRSTPSPKRSSIRRPSPLRNEYPVEETNITQRKAADTSLLQPSNIPKRSRFSIIPLSGRLSPLGFISGAKQNDDVDPLKQAVVSKKNRFSMIPVTGRLSPLQSLKGTKLAMDSSVQFDRSCTLPSTPLPRDAPKKTIPKLTPKATASWTSSLRKYGGGGENENEVRRQDIRSPTASQRSVSPAVKQGKAKPLEGKILRKASPTKVASKRGDAHIQTPHLEVPVRCGPGKAGAGIDHIVPRVSSVGRRAVGKENVGDGPIRTPNEKPKMPVHLRTILGRLTG